MSTFGTGQNLFGAATNQNKDQNPSNPAPTPSAGGGLFGNLGANTTSSTAFGGAGAGGASAGSSGAPGPGTGGVFSGTGGGLFGGGGNANANAPNLAGTGASASPFGFPKPTTAASGGSIFGSGPSGPSGTNAGGPTGGTMGGGGPGLFSGLSSQPKTSDAPAASPSPFGSLPSGSLFGTKAPGTGTAAPNTAANTTANTQPQPTFSLGGATNPTPNTQPQPAFSLGGTTTPAADKTAPAAATAGQCLIFLVTALAKHKGPQQVAGSLRALVPLQTKMESPRKRKTARLVSLEIARFPFSPTLFSSTNLTPFLPWWATPEHNSSLYSVDDRKKGRCGSSM